MNNPWFHMLLDWARQCDPSSYHFAGIIAGWMMRDGLENRRLENWQVLYIENIVAARRRGTLA